MKKLWVGFILFLLFSCKTTQNQPSKSFAIAIHGGAGTILKENITPELESQYKAKLEEAIKKGYQILKNGGTSLEAVQQSIIILEDSPLFNAGKGSVFTNDGKNELDASIMDGKTLKAGSCAGVTVVKNPILLANAIMVNSEHVMMTGKGAEKFAQEQNLEIVDPSYFYTEERFKALERAKKAEEEKKKSEKDSKFGTVGCVALDQFGNLAAGTSTGGMTNKKWGRVGDAPIIGAGTYANNNTCAVSGTGWGEFYIRTVLGHDISALIEYKNESLKNACKQVIDKVEKLGGDGGIIAIDKNGKINFEMNTKGMYRASIDTAGNMYIGIFKED